MPNNEVEVTKTFKLTVLDGNTGSSHEKVAQSPTVWGIRAMVAWVHDTYFFAGDLEHPSEPGMPMPVVFS